MWTNVQFWKDATWRSFRTFCQTLAALLAAQFSGLLQATGGATGSVLPHTPWLGFLYASFIAGLISLLQSVDRERAVGWVASQVTPGPSAPLSATSGDPAAADYQP
jgi:hypothetical protein